jgi:predicted ferric reductase
MQKKNICNIAIIALIALNLTLWLVFPPQNDGRPTYWTQYLGEMFSTSAVLLMTCGIILSTRARFLEPFFGGLDKMYMTHKNVAIAAILLILAHFFIMTTTPDVLTSITIGKLALIGLLLSVGLALAPRIPFWGRMVRLPYHVWRQVHRFTGAFFILGIFHFIGMEVLLIHRTPVVRAYVFPIVIFGAAVYLYKELLQGRLKKHFSYRVEQVQRMRGSVVEVSLLPQESRVPFRAGQFLFIGFPRETRLKEMHPFTISSAPGDEQLKLTIKSSGDFTHDLHSGLQAGATARIDGGYGMFDYKQGTARQVWIAGGIGLTPFLSWLRDFGERLDFEIDFFYSVRTEEEALFLDEFQAAADRHAAFRFHPVFSNRDGRLDAAKIETISGPLAGKEVFLCGPVVMTEALVRQLAARGVRPAQIHFEEFNFR